MTITSSNAQAAAAILAQRRLLGQQGPRLPEALRPADLDAAMQIQLAIVPLMGDEVGGWKCGTPGPDKLVVAPIYARTIHAEGEAPCPVWAHEGAVRVEPELAFVLGVDLPVRDQPYEPAEVDAAICATHLALELIDSRYNDPSVLTFADKLADGLVNQGLFLGPQVDVELACHTHVMPIAVQVDGVPQPARAGQHPDPLPRLPLYWLVEYLRELGLGMRAGQVVITGSYAGTFALPVGQRVAMRYGELGSLEVCFKARSRDPVA